MCKLKRFLPKQVLRILYNSLILPHLQYCILTWGFKSDRLFKLQKRAVRIITCSKYNAHAEPLLKALNLLKVEDIMKIKALKLYYRYKQNDSLNQMIIIHMILDINLFYINYQQRRALHGQLCVRHYIPEILTKTSECITKKLDTYSFSGFSNYMKNYYIQNYKVNCLIEHCYICQN